MAEREDRDVPSWDANVETWEKYKLQVHYYLKQVPYWKQSFQIAKLVRNLRGKCWALVEKLPEKSRAQLEKNEDIFLAFLKKHLLQGEIPELGRVFRLHLGLKRQKGESMMMYVIRHRELFNKLGKSMRSVQGNELERHLKKSLKSISYVEPEEDGDEEGPGEEREERPTRKWGSRQARTEGENESVQGSVRSRWSAKAWQEWETWQQGKWGKQGDWWQQEDGAKAPDEDLDLPKLAREELLQCFSKVAEKLPGGGTDPALIKLAEVVASNWRDEVLPSMLTGWHLPQKWHVESCREIRGHCVGEHATDCRPELQLGRQRSCQVEELGIRSH